LAARRESDSGSGKAGSEDAGGDGNGTRRGAVEGRSAIWCVPGTAGGRGRLVRRLVQAGRAGDAGRDAGARRSARPPNLLKERNKVRPRPRSTARTSGDSTRTPSRSTSASSTSSSSTLGRTSVSRTTSANTPCSSNASSSSLSRPSRNGSTSTARSSSRTPSRANSSSLSKTTRSSSSSTARTCSSSSTPSSSSTTPAPGKPLA
ncbi:unnamed protein product, partial [Closterium sp. NIES-54]